MKTIFFALLFSAVAFAGYSPLSGGGGAPQTPWAQNVDAAGYGLLDLGFMQLNITSQAQAGTTINLTAASNSIQVITGAGASAETFNLPDATTLTVGRQFTFISQMTPTLGWYPVFVYLNDGSTKAVTVFGGDSITLTLMTNGSSNGTWDTRYNSPLVQSNFYNSTMVGSYYPDSFTGSGANAMFASGVADTSGVANAIFYGTYPSGSSGGGNVCISCNMPQVSTDNTFVGYQSGPYNGGTMTHSAWIGAFAGTFGAEDKTFYVDLYERASQADQHANSFMYGHFSASGASAQDLTINAYTSINGLMNLPPQGSGSTPTANKAGDVALTHGFILCVWTGSAWVQPNTLQTACTF